MSPKKLPIIHRITERCMVLIIKSLMNSLHRWIDFDFHFPWRVDSMVKLDHL